MRRGIVAQAIISFFVRQSRANTEIKQSLSLLRRDGRIGSSTITLYKGNACVSRADERVLAIANFPADNIASIGRLAQYLVKRGAMNRLYFGEQRDVASSCHSERVYERPSK